MKTRLHTIKVIKLALGAGLSFLIAESLGLAYASSAGVITLLSIQDTKRETLRVVVRRLVSFGAALVLAWGAFSLAGYHALGLALFLLLFAAFCIRFHMQEGISVNTVLMSHFLSAGTISLPAIGNELALLFLGAGMGILLNLYIPGKRREITLAKQEIEDQMREILLGLSFLVPQEDMPERLSRLEETLDKGEKNAFQDMENQLLTDTRYHLSYMNLRRNQTVMLAGMNESICHLKSLPAQAEAVSGLFRETRSRFHEYNNAAGLLDSLQRLKEAMSREPLPVSRDEFEDRAVLFGLILKLEQFLEAKRSFVEGLTQEEIRTFWTEYKDL